MIHIPPFPACPSANSKAASEATFGGDAWDKHFFLIERMVLAWNLTGVVVESKTIVLNKVLDWNLFNTRKWKDIDHCRQKGLV